jgi:alkylresorcinol/alkylpyrone synthase
MPYIASCHIRPCPYEYSQDELLEAAKLIFHGKIDLDRYASVFKGTGIHRRRFIAPVERLLKDDGWLERCGIFAEEGARLGEEALRGALEQAGLAPDDLGHLFFISTSGIAAPSIDARILGHHPWNPATLRTPVWGLGCAGGISGLARAKDWVAQYPDKAAAVLSVEFLSLTFLPSDESLSNFVASGLFADGVACAIVAGDDVQQGNRPALALEEHRVRLFRDSLEVMGWNPVKQGLQLVFNRRIPSLVKKHAREEFDGLMTGAGKDPGVVTEFLGHPGGPKILDAYRDALGWPEERFSKARRTFSEWGNLSSASILHVLATALEDNELVHREGEHVLLSALGPGFTSEQLLARIACSTQVSTSMRTRTALRSCK